MKNRACLLVCFLLSVLCVHAQNSGSISGVIADSASQKKLALATVTVFKAKDTSIVTYRLSDPSGVFKITGLPFNIPLRLMVHNLRQTQY